VVILAGKHFAQLGYPSDRHCSYLCRGQIGQSYLDCRGNIRHDECFASTSLLPPKANGWNKETAYLRLLNHRVCHNYDGLCPFYYRL